MIMFGKKNIIPIGCSCINQFQINFYFKNKFSQIPFRTCTSIFDWLITTPESVIQFFRFINAGQIKSIMCDKNNYTLENGILKNIAFEGFYFWHEKNSTEIVFQDNQYFTNFSNKVSHTLNNFLSPIQNKDDFTYLLWTNIQPNLKEGMDNFIPTWDAFILSIEKYKNIITEATNIFGKNLQINFICRLEDIDENLLNFNEGNIIILDLPRSPDYLGDENLFDPIFDSIVDITNNEQWFVSKDLQKIFQMSLKFDILKQSSQIEYAVQECLAEELELFGDRAKNWDTLLAYRTIKNEFPNGVRVLDAGGEYYSKIGPWLAVHYDADVTVANLVFTESKFIGRVRYEPGNIERLMYPEQFFDVITSLSVLEHGVNLKKFFSEAYRLLKPGGLLIVSVDYEKEKINCGEIMAFGVPMVIFSADEIEEMLNIARNAGFIVPDISIYESTERPVTWNGKEYGFFYMEMKTKRFQKLPTWLKMEELACKPSSVEDSHSSAMRVTTHL